MPKSSPPTIKPPRHSWKGSERESCVNGRRTGRPACPINGHQSRNGGFSRFPRSFPTCRIGKQTTILLSSQRQLVARRVPRIGSRKEFSHETQHYRVLDGLGRPGRVFRSGNAYQLRPSHIAVRRKRRQRSGDLCKPQSPEHALSVLCRLGPRRFDQDSRRYRNQRRYPQLAVYVQGD